MVADFWQDLRYGARMLLKNSGFSLIAIIVGIARDGKYWSLFEEPRPFFSLPLLQHY